MPPFTTPGLDYFEHVETTSASPQALWAWWVDVPTWGDWSGWSRGSSVQGLFALGSQGVVVDRFGRKAPFSVTHLDRFRSMEIAASLPGATLVVRREIVGHTEGVTTFCHSAWLEGPAARLWRRPLRQRFSSEAESNMRRLAYLADDSGINGRDRERLGHI